MDDLQIIEQYFARDEAALSCTAEKYGALCSAISLNILKDPSDSEENVNDTYMKLWTTIPPTRPNSLGAYIARVARNLALNRLSSKCTLKNNGGAPHVSLEELDSCTPSGVSVEDEVALKELSASISRFLRTQKKTARQLFVRRYFYLDSIEDISNSFSFSRSKVKSSLMRTRRGLKEYLEKEGYECE